MAADSGPPEVQQQEPMEAVVARLKEQRTTYLDLYNGLLSGKTPISKASLLEFANASIRLGETNGSVFERKKDGFAIFLEAFPEMIDVYEQAPPPNRFNVGIEMARWAIFRLPSQGENLKDALLNIETAETKTMPDAIFAEEVDLCLDMRKASERPEEPLNLATQYRLAKRGISAETAKKMTKLDWLTRRENAAEARVEVDRIQSPWKYLEHIVVPAPREPKELAYDEEVEKIMEAVGRDLERERQEAVAEQP